MSSLKLFAISLFCAFFFVFQAAGTGNAAETPPPNLDELIEGLASTKRLVLEQSTSFRIVYARDTSEEFAPYGGLLTTEWVLARKGGNWFKQERYLNPYDDGNQKQRLLNARRDGKKIAHPEPHVTVLKSGEQLNWTQFNRNCEVGVADIYNGWNYFQNLAINVYPLMVEACGERYEDVRRDKRNDLNMDFPFLPEFLQKNRSNYRVRPRQENVEEFPCWVLEWPGMDSIWIDSAHGFAMRRREYHWGPDKPRRLDIVSKDFREVKPRLWLPFTQEVALYVDVRSQPQSLWGKLKNKSVYIVKSIEFDNVPDELFSVRLPAGTTVNDTVRRIQYRVAEAGADPFEGPIEEGLRVLGPSAARKWTIAGTFILLVLLIAVFLIRRRSKLTGAGKN